MYDHEAIKKLLCCATPLFVARSHIHPLQISAQLTCEASTGIMQSYLLGRSQFVQISKAKSDILHMK